MRWDSYLGQGEHEASAGTHREVHEAGAIAYQMAEGIGIGAAARELGFGMETDRTQLKSVFAKTGTRRQAELAALLARFR